MDIHNFLLVAGVKFCIKDLHAGHDVCSWGVKILEQDDKSKINPPTGQCQPKHAPLPPDASSTTPKNLNAKPLASITQDVTATNGCRLHYAGPTQPKVMVPWLTPTTQ